jgi:hypothetical protein
MKPAGMCAATALTMLASAIASAETFETLEPPDSVFAYAYVVRDKVVAGTYFTADNRSLGFIFSPAEGYTSFTIPGAPPDSGPQPTAIDGAGNVSGYYYDASGGSRSFVRHIDGAVESFAVEQPGVRFTQVSDGNRLGATVGLFSPERLTGIRGFRRSAAGVVREIEYPGATYLLPWSINNRGEIAGVIGLDGDYPTRAFIRLARDEWRFFSGPRGCAIGSLMLYLNNARSVAGTCLVPPVTQLGFLRLKGGRAVAFGVPNVNASISVSGITENDDVVGTYQGETGSHGFIRRTNGELISVDAPGSQPGTTNITAAGPHGEVVGTFSDSTGLKVFVRYED